MEDAIIMQSFQAIGEISEKPPYLRLRDHLFLFFVFGDHFSEISSFGVLHYDAECFQLLIEKGLVVVHDVGGMEGGEESNFIQCIFLCFCGQQMHFNLH